MANEEYTCGYCDRTFSDRAALHDHMKTCRNNSEWNEQKVYECPNCGTSFSTSEAFRSHKSNCSP